MNEVTFVSSLSTVFSDHFSKTSDALQRNVLALRTHWRNVSDFSNILINLSRAQPPTPSRISKSDIRTFQQGAIISWKFKKANPFFRHSNTLGKPTQSHTSNNAKVHHKSCACCSRESQWCKMVQDAFICFPLCFQSDLHYCN